MVLFPEELIFEQKPKADRLAEIDSLLVRDVLEREGTKGIPRVPTGVSDRQETHSVFFLNLWVLGKCTCGGQRSTEQATSPWDLLLFSRTPALEWTYLAVTWVPGI